MAHILVVDDSAVMRSNIKHILIQAGHDIVAEASDGRQAYNLYKIHSPDLVTMDITMPKVNGIDAVKEIIADFPEAKIIMVSALDQKQMVLEALKCGAKHYVIKPINTKTLVEVVSKVLWGGVQSTETNKEEVPAVQELDKNQPEEVPASPFVISNVNSTFYIKITKGLSIDNVEALRQASQGLVYVQPLVVAIDFELVTASDELLNKIADINNLILGAKGKLTITSQNKDFIRAVKNKHISGLSELLIE